MNVPPTKTTRSPSFSSNGCVDGAGFAAFSLSDGSAARAGGRQRRTAAPHAERKSAVSGNLLTLFTYVLLAGVAHGPRQTGGQVRPLKAGPRVVILPTSGEPKGYPMPRGSGI